MNNPNGIKGEQKISVNYGQIEQMCKDVYSKILDDGYDPQVLIGVARGGLVPLAYLSHLLDERKIDTVCVRKYRKGEGTEEDVKTEIRWVTPFHIDQLAKYDRFLLVDDIADDGGSLEAVLKEFNTNPALKGKTIKIATLLYKPWSRIKPDFFSQETEAWIIFPWEVGPI